MATNANTQAGETPKRRRGRAPGFAEFPCTLAISLTEEQYGAVAVEADGRGVSKAHVVREWIERGRVV